MTHYAAGGQPAQLALHNRLPGTARDWRHSGGSDSPAQYCRLRARNRFRFSFASAYPRFFPPYERSPALNVATTRVRVCQTGCVGRRVIESKVISGINHQTRPPQDANPPTSTPRNPSINPTRLAACKTRPPPPAPAQLPPPACRHKPALD